jgi:hypothetical protein
MRVTLGSPLRAFLGLLLLTVAAGVVLVTHDLEFGIGWTAVIPALVLGLPGAALTRRRVLERTGDRLCITDGWWWRRAYETSLAGAALERVPTVGLWAVVLRREQQEVTLATWVQASTATTISQALDLPLTTAPGPAADR